MINCSVVVGLLKYLFAVSSIHSFVYYRKTGYFNRKIMKWSNSFCIKLISCMFISVNYSCMAIIFVYLFSYYSYLFFINSFIWILNISCLYFEFRRKLPQSWTGLRLFWLMNGIVWISKFIFIVSLYDEDTIKLLRGLIMLFMIQGLLSMILLYFSICYFTKIF